ncbi:protein Isd11p [Diutina catenulata]
MAGPKEVLQLYKQLLQKASKFDNYNFREFALRKVRDSFHENKCLSGDAITTAYNNGINELALLKRQAAISQMYTFDKLVVEPLKHHH